MSRFEFELHGAEVAERGVQTLTIVPSFDVLEDGCVSSSSRLKLPISAFGLECAEKAFHGRVVKAIAGAAHADLAMLDSQSLLIKITGVLAALIRMMEQVSRGAALRDRHVPSLLHQGGFHVLLHGPAHHAARKQIQDRSQVQPAFGGIDVGDIAHPFSIGRRRRKILVEQIGGRPRFWIPLRGARHASTSLSSGDLVPMHQAGHPFPTAGDSFAFQGGVDARTAIGFSAELEFFPDPHQQPLIRLISRAWATIAPGIISAAARAQHLAHAFHVKLVFMGCHEFVPHPLAREKMFTAFFRISRSSSTSASFRCKRRISALAASRSLASR